MPEFLASQSALSKFIEQNLQYPRTSLKNGVQGTVIVGFIVNEDSSLSNFHIRNGINKEIDDEALRVTKMIRRIAPGSINNQNVKVILSFPIRFDLNAVEDGEQPDVIKHIGTNSLASVGNKVNQIFDRMPEFPGGEKALLKFIRKNINYPAYEKSADIQGRVIVGFVVNEFGNISDVTIKKGVSKGINTEAIRVVKLFPNFIPGSYHGQAVKIAFVLPIDFKLEDVYESDYYDRNAGQRKGSSADYQGLWPSKK